ASAVACFDVNVDFVYKQLFERLNRDHSAVRAVILELHAAGDLGEDRVVLPDPRVQPWAEPTPALADDDRAAGHDVAVVRLDAEPLRVRVAAVARAALSFFMSHFFLPAGAWDLG